MKLRPDIVSVYRELHSWVGVLAGLFLFIAFYAGAISMFEPALESFLTPRIVMPEPVALERTPELLEKAFAAFPAARGNYSIVLTTDADHPARLVWPVHGARRGHGSSAVMMAALDERGDLVTRRREPPAVASFIDTLHQQMGLPLPHEPAMIVMGVITLGYALALVTGTVVFLPALARALFAVRLVGNVRRKWLDLHNLLGFCSLPFHIIMAVTSVVFAFHDVIFTVQARFLAPQTQISGAASGHGGRAMAGLMQSPPHAPGAVPLTPEAIVTRLTHDLPGFIPDTLDYSTRPGGRGGAGRSAPGHDAAPMLRVAGHDPAQIMRGPNNGFATLDPYTGALLWRDYLPGHQGAGFAALTSPFALHFGSYGGASVRWAYLVLGFGGAFLFYTGNKLWIAVRQKREKATGHVRETRGTWFLARLTTGCCLGCMSGIASLLILALFRPDLASETRVFAVYHAVFWTIMLLAFAGRYAEQALLWLASGLYFLLALSVAVREGQDLATGWGVAFMAALLSVMLVRLARRCAMMRVA